METHKALNLNHILNIIQLHDSALGGYCNVNI
jgi:hypothetical protein